MITHYQNLIWRFFHTSNSAQNNSRPSVNFRPYNLNNLAKQLTAGHNNLTIGFNRFFMVHMHYYISVNLATYKVLALYCQKLKMVCQTVRAWHFWLFCALHPTTHQINFSTNISCHNYGTF